MGLLGLQRNTESFWQCVLGTVVCATLSRFPRELGAQTLHSWGDMLRAVARRGQGRDETAVFGHEAISSVCSC